MYTITNSHKKARREQADKRNEACAKLTPEQRLALLDEKGLRAVNERERLHAQIKARDAAKHHHGPKHGATVHPAVEAAAVDIQKTLDALDKPVPTSHAHKQAYKGKATK